jgi:carotenoid cleavage dioxygenase
MPLGMNAHPKVDPDTGDVHVLAYGFEAPFLRYHRITAEGHLARSEEIDLGGPVMVHDMGYTESRIVIFDLPVVFSWDLALAGVGIPFQWDPAYRARVGVMPLAGGPADIAWIDVPPCYIYHPLNAYDDGDRVVLDTVVHERAFADELGTPAAGTQTFQRWTLDTVGRTLSAEVVDERPQEFPRGDPRLVGRRHRYGYLLESSLEDALDHRDTESAVVKHDLVAGTSERHAFRRGVSPSEFVFVPASDDAGEDEGWLMGYAYDAARDASDLVILDAHDIGAGPVASVHLPARVPQGFHGNWIP